MICGFDTYHDSSRKGRSAGAFVASLNQNCTRWYSKVSFHAAGGWQELSDHMRINFTSEYYYSVACTHLYSFLCNVFNVVMDVYQCHFNLLSKLLLLNIYKDNLKSKVVFPSVKCMKFQQFEYYSFFLLVTSCHFKHTIPFI